MPNIKNNNNFFKCLLTESPWREPTRQELARGEVLSRSMMICKVGTNSYLYSLHGEFSSFHELQVSPGYRGSLYRDCLSRIYRLIYKAQWPSQATTGTLSEHRLRWQKKKRKQTLSQDKLFHTNPADL